MSDYLFLAQLFGIFLIGMSIGWRLRDLWKQPDITVSKKPEPGDRLRLRVIDQLDNKRCGRECPYLAPYVCHTRCGAYFVEIIDWKRSEYCLDEKGAE